MVQNFSNILVLQDSRQITEKEEQPGTFTMIIIVMKVNTKIVPSLIVNQLIISLTDKSYK